MDLIITILPVVTKDLPISPRFTPYDFLLRCKFSTLTTLQPMVEFYLFTFPRFPLRMKEQKSHFGKNRTHDFRTTSRCAGYLLDHSGDYIPYTPSYTVECNPCLLCGMFGARSSSGTDHNIPRKECVTLIDAWGTRGSRERCLEWWCGVMRCNNFSRTSREVEVLLDHIDDLGVTVQTHLRRRSGR